MGITGGDDVKMADKIVKGSLYSPGYARKMLNSIFLCIRSHDLNFK